MTAVVSQFSYRPAFAGTSVQQASCVVTLGTEDRNGRRLGSVESSVTVSPVFGRSRRHDSSDVPERYAVRVSLPEAAGSDIETVRRVGQALLDAAVVADELAAKWCR